MKQIVEDLKEILQLIKDQIKKELIPSLKIKTRSKTNLYLHQEGFWSLNDQKNTQKTLKTKGGSREILKLVHTIVYLIEQLKKNKTSTLREFYYNALNWIDQAQFEKMNESNLCLENVQILVNKVREDFGIYPGCEGRIFGPLVVSYKTRTGEERIVDCTKDVGTSGFLLPRSISELKIISNNGKFILAIETDGLFNRLVEEKFDQKYGCILMVTGGQASRMSKKFLKLMHDDYGLRTAIFTDGDIHGINIANNIISGSIKSSHLSDMLCTPSAQHIGLYPSQTLEYKVPTYEITPLEKNHIRLMKEDPRYQHLIEELEIMERTGLKAEQQAFSYHGLTYVTDNYLPQVLKKYNFI